MPIAVEVRMLGRHDRLKPASPRAEPIGRDRKPGEEPGEALALLGPERRERRRTDHAQSLVDERPGRAEADRAGNLPPQVGRIEVAWRAAVMPGYRPEQRIPRAGASPLREQRIDAWFQRPAKKRVTSIIMEAGRRLHEWAERPGPQLGDFCLKWAGKFADIVERHQGSERL